jgi:hypothetical protein
VAHTAVAYLRAQLHRGLAKATHVGDGLLEKVQHEAKRSLSTDARQFGKLAHGALKKGRCKFLFHPIKKKSWFLSNKITHRCAIAQTFS